MIMTDEKTNWYSELDSTILEMKEYSKSLRAINKVKDEKKNSSLLRGKNDDDYIKIRNEQNNLIKKILRKELTNESIQDFLKIFFSPYKSLKVFWTASTLIAVSLTSYLVVQSVLTYLSYGVNTTTRNIVENPTDFPKITICKLV